MLQNYLRRIREDRGLTLDDVATRIGVTKAQLSKLERNLIRIHDGWLASLADIYQCSIHDLIDDSESFSERSSGVSKLITVKAVGKLMIREAGCFEEFEPTNIYNFRIPAMLTRCSNYSRYEAYEFDGNGFCDIADKALGIFAVYNSGVSKIELANNDVVILEDITTKTKLVRIIKYQRDAIPSAVYRLTKNGRIQTLSNHYLMDEEQLLKLVASENEDAVLKDVSGNDVLCALPRVCNKFRIYGKLITTINHFNES